QQNETVLQSYDQNAPKNNEKRV
ncbi:unnamed protein product, partial [Rotaria sordida]